MNVPVVFRMKIKISKSRPSLLISGIICLNLLKNKIHLYLKLKYSLSLLKIHEKYKKYIFRIIFYVSFIKNDKQTKKKGKEINIFKSLARSNVFSTKSEEQEMNFCGLISVYFDCSSSIYTACDHDLFRTLNEYQWISKL